MNLNNSYSYVVTNSNNKDVTKWFSKKKRCNQMSKLLLQTTISLPELLRHIYQTKNGV